MERLCLLLIVFVKELPMEFSYTLRDLVDTEDPVPLYPNMEKLDEGSMGKVYVAAKAGSNNNNNGAAEKVAIKKVKLSPDTLSHMITEIAILKGCRLYSVVVLTND
jgi:hypothetical protein